MSRKPRPRPSSSTPRHSRRPRKAATFSGRMPSSWTRTTRMCVRSSRTYGWISVSIPTRSVGSRRAGGHECRRGLGRSTRRIAMTIEAKPTVAALLERSNRLGSDPRNTNYAGGNTSAKGTAIDPATGAPVELLWVKGSGGDLGTLSETGLAVLRLDRLRALVDVYPGVDREDEMVAAFDYCLHGRGGAVPSG